MGLPGTVVLGEYVNALTQSVLMSISIARTAPAACSVLRQRQTDIAGPPA